MSDHVTRPSLDEEATSGTSLEAKRSSWMSHWMKRCSKPASVGNNSSLILYKGQVDQKSGLAQGGPIMEDGLPKSGKGAGLIAEVPTSMISETKKNVGNLKKISNSPAPTLSLCPDKENTSTLKTETEYEFDHKNISLALALDREGTDLICENNLRSNEKHAVSNLFEEQKGNVVSSFGAFNKRGPTCFSPDQSNHAETSGPIVASGRHFSNDNFTFLDQCQCKYKKFSTLLFHQKKMNDNISDELQLSDQHHMQHDPSMGKNFLPFFLKKRSKCFPGRSASGLFPCQRSLCDVARQKLCHGCLSLDRVPCSVRNVETMRICTMVDSVKNLPGGPSKISQRAHHFLFTKETSVNLSKDCQAFREPTLSAHLKEKTLCGSLRSSPDIGSSHSPGVRIEPLWTTSDDTEMEITGDPLTSKLNSRNDSSFQADTMQVDDVKNQLIPLGMASFPLKKDDSMDENIPQAAFGSSTEKARSKRPITEMPDINEEVPALKPAGSSTDSKEPSTSRVRSLNAKHLFRCGEQTSRPEFNARHDPPPVNHDPSIRWIKRLRVSSSDSFRVGTKSSEIGEASSRKKFGVFVKSNIASLDPMLNKQQGNELTTLDQFSECPPTPSKRNQSLMIGCPWIKRWRRNPNAAPSLKNPEPLVICEPNSLKLGLDELGRKQFPSIAAIALMGKTMNGFRSCEFKKRGSVVVWNTKEY